MSRIMKYLLSLLAALVLIGGVAFVAGVRVVVIQPIGALPEGVTMVVTGVSGLNFIDSADAYCIRQEGYVSILCRAGILGAVANQSNVLFHLPYSQMLFDLSGGNG